MKRPYSLTLLAGLIQIFLVLSNSATASSNKSYHVYVSNNPPFNFQDKNGIAQGIAVDVLKIIGRRSGTDIIFSNDSFINWARAVHYTNTKPLNILLSPARTPKREEMFEWVGPLNSFDLGLISRKDREIEIPTGHDLSKLNLGVIRKSAPIPILQTEFGIKESDLTILNNDEQLFSMLNYGRIDLFPRGNISAVFLMNKLGLNPNEYEMVYVIKKVELYIAFSPTTAPSLIEQLNDELQKLQKKRLDGSSEYSDIVNRHTQGHQIDTRL